MSYLKNNLFRLNGPISVFFLVIGSLIALSPIASISVAADFSVTLQDHLGRQWTDERVRFPISDEAYSAASDNAALIAPDGRPVAFELLDAGRHKSIEFLANLPKFGQTTYRLLPGQSPAHSTLSVTQTAGQIRLENAAGGIAIRTQLTGNQAPIAGIKMPSGIWGGDSQIAASDDPIVSYRAEIERRGQVAAVVVCSVSFSSGRNWRLRITLQAKDPAILVDERWSHWKHPAVHIDFGPSLPGEFIYHRNGSGKNVGRVASSPARPKIGNRVFELEPWLRWWLGERRGNWFTAYDTNSEDTLTIAALRADRWISKAEYAKGHRLTPMSVVAENAALRLLLTGQGTHRSWMLAGMHKSQAMDLELIGKRVATPPQQLVIRHGDFPLNHIKDLTLDWSQDSSTRARLLLTENDRARLGGSSTGDWKTRKRLGLLPLRYDTLHEFLDYYLRTDDKKIGLQISRKAVELMQHATDMFLEQNPLVTMGFAPHHQRDIMIATHLADFALADGFLPPDQLKRLRAQAAFLSYVVHRPDYWSQRRGFGANPNMSTIVAGYQGMLACLLHDHPRAAQWLDTAIAELFDEQLLRWSDKNGGWLEAPSYAMLSYDHMLGVFACARNQGRPDYLFHPRMKRIAEWFAKISTPPDPRIGGRRHHPPIGNTYMLEPTGQFGTLAHLWRDKDPAFSAQMQWMHRASGETIMSNVGGYAPAFGPYQTIFKNAALPAQRPDYGSELFPKTGAILRSHFSSKRETQLHIIAGSNHDHYDHDSGSITIWGKGHLIADDFGYYSRAPRNDHSMVDAKSVGGTMSIKAFAAQENLDFFQGKSGQWTRQIAMLKDDDPLGANAYVIRDHLAGGHDGTWRLWLNAKQIDIQADRVHIIGHEDIDTDVIFLSGVPKGLRIEKKSRTSASSFFNKPYTTTQHGLIVPMSNRQNEIAILVYPRLKTEATPQVETAMNGRVLTLKAGSDRQTLLLSQTPFGYRDETIVFNGTVGLLKAYDDIIVATLGANGSISANGYSLISEQPASRSWPALSFTGAQ